MAALGVACGGADADRFSVREQSVEDSVPSPPSDLEGARGAVVFLGTSLTAGFGVSLAEAFPSLIQTRLDSAKIPLQVVNAGVSGETSAGGLRRLEPLLEYPLEVLVLELGANDGLRGLDLGDLDRNLQAIVDQTRAAHPDAQLVIAGMEAPPNLGVEFTDRFRQIFVDLAARNDAALIPFLLDGVAGVSTLNQSDRIHPNVEGHRVVAENVWKVLAPILIDN